MSSSGVAVLAPAEVASEMQEALVVDTLEAQVEALVVDLQTQEVDLEELVDPGVASQATEGANLVDIDELDAEWAALVPPTTPPAPQLVSPVRAAWPPADPLAPVVESDDEFGSESSAHTDPEIGDVPAAGSLEPIELALTPDLEHSKRSSETRLTPPLEAGPSDAAISDATTVEPVARPHVPQLVTAFEQLGPLKGSPAEPRCPSVTHSAQRNCTTPRFRSVAHARK